jgi:hypothetical protein
VNKMMLGIVPVVIIAVVLGLGFSGMINIPGITPKKALKGAAANYTQKGDPKPVAKLTQDPPKSPPVVESPKKDLPPAPTKNPEQGAEALAAVWNEVKTPELILITANWKEDELVKVLLHMDGDKVAKLLDQLAKGDSENHVKEDPLRASKLSKILQEQSSVVKPKVKSGETT